MSIWTPPQPPSEFEGLVSTYLTEDEVFEHRTTESELVSLTSSIPPTTALFRLSLMLEMVDKPGYNQQAVDLAWADRLFSWSPIYLTRARSQVQAGARLLAPQLLLLCMREILSRPHNLTSPDEDGLDEKLVRLLLAVAQRTSNAIRVVDERWAGLPLGLSANLIASAYHNHTIDPTHSFSNAEHLWRREWPTSVPVAVRARLKPTPQELFKAATDIPFDSFLAYATWLWSISFNDGRVLTTREELSQVTGDAELTDRFLTAVSANLDQFRQEISEELVQYRGSPWAFDTFRRRPILQIDSENLLVLRPAFLIDRVTGTALNWDVRNWLQTTSDQSAIEAFNACLGADFEELVGDSLRHIFGQSPRSGRLYSEQQMKKAWKLSKRRGKRVCDWVVDGGSRWICFEVANRALPRAVVNGAESATILDREVKWCLDEMDQAIQTTKLIKSTPEVLTGGRHVGAGTRFVPLVIVPSEGLPWGPGVAQRLDELSTNRPAGVENPAIMTLTHLRELESLGESGHDIVDLLDRWRNEAPNRPLDRFIVDAGLPLRHPRSERDAFQAVMDSVLDQVASLIPGSPPRLPGKVGR